MASGETPPQVMWDSAVVEAYGNDRGLLAGLKVKNLKTEQVNDVEVCGVEGSTGCCTGPPRSALPRRLHCRKGVWSGLPMLHKGGPSRPAGLRCPSEHPVGAKRSQPGRVRLTAVRPTQVSGLFFAIGHEPASHFLANQLQLDADGYIDTSPGSTTTSVEGVFAAGDVQDKKYRQAITAAGTGAAHALAATLLAAACALTGPAQAPPCSASDRAWQPLRVSSAQAAWLPWRQSTTWPSMACRCRRTQRRTGRPRRRPPQWRTARRRPTATLQRPTSRRRSPSPSLRPARAGAGHARRACAYVPTAAAGKQRGALGPPRAVAAAEKLPHAASPAAGMSPALLAKQLQPTLAAGHLTADTVRAICGCVPRQRGWGTTVLSLTFACLQCRAGLGRQCVRHAMRAAVDAARLAIK